MPYLRGARFQFPMSDIQEIIDACIAADQAAKLLKMDKDQ